MNSDQERIQHGAMRISQVLATGLSPVLQFVLERTYDGLDPDVLSGMFDNAPPYKHMDQLLQALQPKVRLLSKSPTPPPLHCMVQHMSILPIAECACTKLCKRCVVGIRNCTFGLMNASLTLRRLCGANSRKCGRI